MKLYEGMFLVDNSKANNDWDAVAAHVHGILERHGAAIKRSQKWGERKLAYEIAGHKRCTFMLVHFEAGGDAIGRIRRDAGLSDTIVRTLITIDQDGEEVPDILGDVAPPPGRDSDSRRSRGPRTEERPKPTKPAEAKAAPAEKETKEPESAEPKADATEPPAEPKADAAEPPAEPKADATEPPAEPKADTAEPPAEPQQDADQS